MVKDLNVRETSLVGIYVQEVDALQPLALRPVNNQSLIYLTSTQRFSLFHSVKTGEI